MRSDTVLSADWLHDWADTKNGALLYGTRNKSRRDANELDPVRN